jgi:hypothetical protein
MDLPLFGYFNNSDVFNIITNMMYSCTWSYLIQIDHSRVPGRPFKYKNIKTSRRWFIISVGLEIQCLWVFGNMKSNNHKLFLLCKTGPFIGTSR